MTPAQKKMFERIKDARSPLLETALLASGGRAVATLRQLVGLGFVVAVDHPSVIDRRTNTRATAFKAVQ